MAYDVINLETDPCTNHTFALNVLEGFSKTPKSIPSEYLYDVKGSLLFEQIMELTEYYQTRCELEIINRIKNDFRQLLGDHFRIVELGVGDAKKTRVLLRDLLEHGLSFEYVPIDCCQEMVLQVVQSLKSEFKNYPLQVLGVVAEYSSALSWLSKLSSIRNVVLFLGSSIGNFDPREAHHFLHHMWNSLSDGDFVCIGFDLKKEISVLEQAYDDARGVTREFNLNLLDRMNKELHANFVRDCFYHHSFYNPGENRIESWLISLKDQIVTFGSLQKAFHLEAWEGIHVENSYKYSRQDIEMLAKSTGFSCELALTDSKGFFEEAIWQVRKLHTTTEASP